MTSTPAQRRSDSRPTQHREWPGYEMGDRLGSLKVVVCAGSGGVGKTTVSAALAIMELKGMARHVGGMQYVSGG